MNHLLIILISILLLSSPVIGDRPVVLYQYITSTGIKWKTFEDGKVQPKYKGEIKYGDMWLISSWIGKNNIPIKC